MNNLILQTPAFQRWRGKSTSASLAEEDEVLSYIDANFRLTHLLFAVDILWPEFVEVEQYILRRQAIPTDWERFKREASAANWSDREVEYVINHTHISDLFLNDPDIDEVDTLVLDEIAKVVAELWRCRLKNLFPLKEFSVGVEEGEVDPEVFAYRLVPNER